VFWDGEEDEWMMRDAIVHEGQVYHRSCFDADTVLHSSAPGQKRTLDTDEDAMEGVTKKQAT
jgi:hypothetical protein